MNKKFSHFQDYWKKKTLLCLHFVHARGFFSGFLLFPICFGMFLLFEFIRRHFVFAQGANCFFIVPEQNKSKTDCNFRGKTFSFLVPKKKLQFWSGVLFCSFIEGRLHTSRLEKLMFSFIQIDSWQLLIYSLPTKNDLNCSFFCFLGSRPTWRRSHLNYSFFFSTHLGCAYFN